MARLRNRIIPADWLTDGRLLSVSPEARALALVLEHIAEDTGVVSENIIELRSLGGQFLADTEGRMPTADELRERLTELVGVSWAIRYDSDGMPLLYLKGFGDRQQGPSVGIGVSKASGLIAPHLPLPECVRLEKPAGDADKWAKSNRIRPVHCERSYMACPPCLEATRELATAQLQQSRKESESRKEARPESLNESEPRDEGVGVKGEGQALTPEERIELLTHRLGQATFLRARQDAQTLAEKRGGEVTPDMILFYLEAEAERAIA